MKPLIFRKTPRKCSVRGCGGKNATLYARSHDMSSSVWICDDCVRDMFNTLKKLTKKQVTEDVDP